MLNTFFCQSSQKKGEEKSSQSKLSSGIMPKSITDITFKIVKLADCSDMKNFCFGKSLYLKDFLIYYRQLFKPCMWSKVYC